MQQNDDVFKIIDHKTTTFSRYLLCLKCAARHNKGSVFFKPQCAFSTSPPLLAFVLDVEKIRLPSFGTDSNPRVSDRQWTYTGTIGPSTEVIIFNYVCQMVQQDY